MRALAAADVLALWDCTERLHPIDRALDLLARAFPDRDREDLCRLALGERDALLLAVRRAVFGDRLEAEDRCPACGERVEFELRCSALLENAAPSSMEWSLDSGSYRLTLRSLDSGDAAAAALCEGIEAGREVLLARCVVAAEIEGTPIAATALPASVREEVSASLASHDQHAETLLDLACPGCGHAWQSVFDVASFVWAELSARAQRLLLEVHALSRAYGWTEADVLALSERRRAAYLGMIGA
jgi:hypothetical protein